jgi:hypothetical protein
MAAGQPLKTRQTGEPFKPSARDWNAFIRTATRPTRVPPPAKVEDVSSQTVLLVKNNSGADVPRFGVLGIDDFLIGPSLNLSYFQSTPMLAGVTPTAAGHTGYFVIAVEPVPAGSCGRCVIAGMAVAKINMVSAAHLYADVYDGDATKLKSGAVGSAQILLVQSGTGDKWGLVRIGNPSPQLQMIKVTGNTLIGSATGLPGGVYRGRTWQMPAAAITLTGSTFTGTEVGSDPGADDCYFVNLPERGETTHALTTNSPTYAMGLLRGTSTDGYPVYAGPMMIPGC